MTVPVAASVVPSADAVSAADWDACAGTESPFTLHAFFSALERSGSASASTGWQPAHLQLEDEAGAVLGIAPGYVKSHSQGEYVFDHGWADAFMRAGGRYYPKYQMSVPFTPATGRRLLLREEAHAPALLGAVETLCAEHGLSSAHATFVAPEQVPLFEDAGWLIRHDEQFHWHNGGYGSFEDFLGALSSRKRKTIRRERREAAESGLSIVPLTGRAITETHWDAFWDFYQDTGGRKWGRPYLTRAFFSMVGEAMAERILLVLAFDGARAVAGALNFIGGDCLYGRYWGTLVDLPFLHFELCYYQAIDYAVAHGLARVEAGAQGPHKLARGYVPVTTSSAHFIRHPALRAAVAEFLERERPAVEAEIRALGELTPYRKTESR
jgi:predicted N-acyltransferase